MAYSSSESSPGDFGFTDLHGFKDYVGFVILCAPDQFPQDDWLKPDQWLNLDRAFAGLRHGLQLTALEKGSSEIVNRCGQLVEEAYTEYQAGRDVAGQHKLEEMDKLLSTISSR